MTQEQELISYNIFENSPDVAIAINKFTILKGNLVDQIFYSFRHDYGNFKTIDKILHSIGCRLGITYKDDGDGLARDGDHGYYIVGEHNAMFIEMINKRKFVFDTVCKAYEITIPGMVWK